MISHSKWNLSISCTSKTFNKLLHSTLHTSKRNRNWWVFFTQTTQTTQSSSRSLPGFSDRKHHHYRPNTERNRAWGRGQRFRVCPQHAPFNLQARACTNRQHNEKMCWNNCLRLIGAPPQALGCVKHFAFNTLVQINIRPILPSRLFVFVVPYAACKACPCSSIVCMFSSEM